MRDYFKAGLLHQYSKYNISLDNEAALDRGVDELMADKKNTSEARFYIRANKMVDLFKNKFTLENKEVTFEEFIKNRKNN